MIPNKSGTSTGCGDCAGAQSGDDVQVAVLVLNRNGVHFLDDCFRSVFENSFSPFHVYLIDNASEDDSVSFTERRYPGVRIIRNEENLGFAEAYDRAVRNLEYEYLVFLNNDTTVDGNWLRTLVDAAESDPRVAACGSKILMMWDKTVIDHAGGMFTPIGSGLDLGKWSKDRGEYARTKETGFACGCSLLVKRKAYLEVGGFDTGYFIFHEDVDLCWRLRWRGYSVLYTSDSIVYHHVGGGRIRAIDENPFKVFLCQKNRLANMIKNIEPARFPAAFAVSIIYDLFRLSRFVFMKRGDLLKAVLHGYGRTFASLGDLLEKRGAVRRGRAVRDAEIRRFFSSFGASIETYRTMLRAKNPV